MREPDTRLQAVFHRASASVPALTSLSDGLLSASVSQVNLLHSKLFLVTAFYHSNTEETRSGQIGLPLLAETKGQTFKHITGASGAGASRGS